MSQLGTTCTAPTTSNTIKVAEQSGNIAKQRFAGKGGLEAGHGNMGGTISKW